MGTGEGWGRLGHALCLAALIGCDGGAGADGHGMRFVGAEVTWRVSGAAHVAAFADDALWIAPVADDPIAEGARLRTVRIARLGTAADRLGRSVTVDDDGLVTIDRGRSCVEELVNREHGVEQRWRFDAAPDGEGDLLVEVDAGEASLLSTSSAGLHFRARRGFQFRYGHATWIDAGGESTPLPVQWADGSISIRVPAALVDASEYPVVLDPIVGLETELDAPVLSPSAQSESLPSADFDGANHLVVWRDGRDGFALYGARVSAAGAVLDDYGIRFAPGVLGGSAVSAGGSGWLVVWEHLETTGAGGLMGVRVAADGTVAGAPMTVLASSSSVPREVRMASDGTGYLVTYIASSRLYALRLLSDGSPSGAPVEVGIGPQRHDLAWGGGYYLAVWDDSSNVRAARLEADGTLVDTVPIAIATEAWQEMDPAVATDGTGFLVVWQDARDLVFAGVDIWGARVDASGTLGAAFVVGGATGDQGAPTAAFDGTYYHVAWEDARDPVDTAIYGGRITTAGALLDGTGIRVDDTSLEDALPLSSGAGGSVLAIWEVESKLVARPVSSTGTPTAPSTYVATAANEQAWPRIAESATGYLVAWTDYRDYPDYGDVHAVRLDLDGNPVGGTIAVSTGPAFDSVGGIAFDGAHYLVVWHSFDGTDYDLYGARIDAATGALVDSGGRALVTAAADQYSPTVSHDGASWLVAWMDSRAGGTRWADVYAARFDASLASLDGSGLALSSVQRAEPPVEAAAVAGTHFVIWRFRVPGSTAVEARGARIVGGTVLDPEGRALGGSDPFGLDADGTGFMALSHGSGGRLYATHVDTAGTTAIHTVFTGAGLYRGGIAWDGTGWLAVFHDASSSLSRVRGTRVTSGGSIIDAPFDISPSGQQHGWPQAASAGGGRSVVAYTRFTPGAPYDAHRAWVRTVGGALLTDGTACASPSACASGFCVAGICCATACDDGLSCNGSETCPGGTCTAGAPTTCDDGDACTTDACTEASGCTFTPITGCGDAGPSDAGPPDAGPPDAGPPDAGSTDGGSDAGPPDAGPPDAGSHDSGVLDAGRADAGRDAGSTDAGPDPEPPPPRDRGCGCSTPAGSGDAPVRAVWILSIAWWLGRRSRRARSASPPQDRREQ